MAFLVGVSEVVENVIQKNPPAGRDGEALLRRAMPQDVGKVLGEGLAWNKVKALSCCWLPDSRGGGGDRRWGGGRGDGGGLWEEGWEEGGRRTNDDKCK